jgi:hypothetical protein
MEHVSRKFEQPKTPEHRDAYLALTQHCTNLVESFKQPPDEVARSRDLDLESPIADILVEIPRTQTDDVITNITREAHGNDDTLGQITYYTQTQDDIWRKQVYGSRKEVPIEYLAPDRPGTFEELYGPAIDPPEAYALITELLHAKIAD